MRVRATIATAVAICATLVPQAASAHEPYGGCDEAWQAPYSRGADHCRDHGWIVPVAQQRWTAWWHWTRWFR